MPQIGELIDSRWEIYEKLTDDTGQGNTFIVTDKNESSLKKKYVIKLLKNEDEKSIARFKREIQSCMHLKHPNIIKVVAASGNNEVSPYLVTEFYPGRELTSEKITTLSMLERLRMFRSVCDAIAYAHSQKIAHRDIKPRNILFKTAKSLTPIVCDFGLSFLKGEDMGPRLTGTREAWGNWEFRPPEADIGRVDSGGESADVYMLGKLLYWLLSDGQLLVREYHEVPEFDLRKKSDAHSVHFAYDIMKKSIVENASARYQTAADMLVDVKELVKFTEAGGKYLDCELPQACVFCRVGAYRWQVIPSIREGHFDYQASRFDGLTFNLDGHDTHVSTYPIVLFGRCRRCGNVQQFRLDKEMTLTSKWQHLPEPK